MKKIKSILAGIVAVSAVSAVSVSAFAEEIAPEEPTPAPEDVTEVDIFEAPEVEDIVIIAPEGDTDVPEIVDEPEVPAAGEEPTEPGDVDEPVVPDDVEEPGSEEPGAEEPTVPGDVDVPEGGDIVPGDVDVPEAGDTSLVEKVTAQYTKLFGDKMDQFVEKIKASIEAAGGVEAIVDNAMEQFEGKTPEELKAIFVDQLKENGVSEEQINKIMEFYNSEAGEGAFDTEMYRNVLTGLLTSIQTSEGATGLFETVIASLDDETLEKLSEVLDALEAAKEAAEDKPATDNPETGDNADTGVEGVAAVVGVIAVAGAAVVISRKRA